MASVVTYNDGLRRIEFRISPGGKRKHLRLGRVSSKVAAAYRSKVESIVADLLAHRPHEPELSAWLGKLDAGMLAKFRAVGLAQGVGVAAITLGEFMEREKASQSCKTSTATFYGHTRRNMIDFFGKQKLLRTITTEDADRWRAWLMEHEGLSPATVARRVVAARTIWRRAVRWRLASENPFVGVKGGCQANDARKVFVPAAVIEQVMEELPDLEWRAIIALARYGGLRIPSEAFALRWGDIDWDRGEVRVTAVKLAHIPKCAFRVLPLFPELRAHLLALFEAAPPGTEFVITQNRLGCNNLRTQFERILRRSGVAPWPRLFHNLRGSRETELLRGYDIATVCQWIGNSPEVAARHYASSTDLNADFRRATGRSFDTGPQAQQKAQQSADSSRSQGVTEGLGGLHETAENKPKVARGRSVPQRGTNDLWAQQDSNLRPRRYQRRALAN